MELSASSLTGIRCLQKVNSFAALQVETLWCLIKHRCFDFVCEAHEHRDLITELELFLAFEGRLYVRESFVTSLSCIQIVMISFKKTATITDLVTI